MYCKPSTESSRGRSSGLSSPTCGEEQQGLHAQILLVGHLEAGQLSGHHEHVLALFVHTREVHPLPEEEKHSTQ